MNLENIPYLRIVLRKQRIMKASINLKKDYLARLPNDIITMLCTEKGIPMTRTIVEKVNIDNPNPITPIPQRELLEIIAKTIPAKEIIYFSEQKGIECNNFKLAFNTLLTELEFK